MALPSSGSISLLQLQSEFGGSAPIAMSEYYRGAGLITANNSNVPASGLIALSHFHGAVKVVPGSYDFSSPATTSVLIPAYTTLIITVWGAGGGGAANGTGSGGGGNYLVAIKPGETPSGSITLTFAGGGNGPIEWALALKDLNVDDMVTVKLPGGGKYQNPSNSTGPDWAIKSLR